MSKKNTLNCAVISVWKWDSDFKNCLHFNTPLSHHRLFLKFYLLYDMTLLLASQNWKYFVIL